MKRLPLLRLFSKKSPANPQSAPAKTHLQTEEQLELYRHLNLQFLSKFLNTKTDMIQVWSDYSSLVENSIEKVDNLWMCVY